MNVEIQPITEADGVPREAISRISRQWGASYSYVTQMVDVWVLETETGEMRFFERREAPRAKPPLLNRDR